MPKPSPSSLTLAIQELQEARAKMRLASANIGEPAVEVPMEYIHVYRDQKGDLRAIIGLDKFILVAADLLRASAQN